MTRLRDLTGQKLNRLLVLGREPGIFKRVMWRVRCDCGRETVVSGPCLLTSHTKSCGCWRLEVFSRAGKKTGAINSRKGAAKAAESRKRHGHATDNNGTRTYSTWEGMVARCHNPNSASYKRYGAKGVKVCDRWRDFANFLADMGEKPGELTIDRINPFGNYEPGNCRWADRKTQAQNTRKRYAQRAG